MRPAAAENTGQKAKRRIPHLSQTANNDLSARRSRVAIKVMTWVWEQSRSKKTERLVLLAIADCASEDGANAYPSMAELRRKTGLSERGVQSAIGNLVKLGELFVGRNMGPRGCNRYRFIMSTPARNAPRKRCGAPQILHPRPRKRCGRPPQPLHPEPSLNRP
jgi:hypothetical protein